MLKILTLIVMITGLALMVRPAISDSRTDVRVFGCAVDVSARDNLYTVVFGGDSEEGQLCQELINSLTQDRYKLVKITPGVEVYFPAGGVGGTGPAIVHYMERRAGRHDQ